MAEKQALVEGAWAGSEAYLVGGGPSLRAFDWSLLAGKSHVAVVNGAMRECPTAELWFSEDIRFVEKFNLEPWWSGFKGLKVFHALDPQYRGQALACDPSITIIEKHGGQWQRNDKFWSKRFADGLSWSSNSMIGLLNIVDLLGADPIVLLGVDCVPRHGHGANYHELYPKDWETGDMQMESFKSDFSFWAAPHLRHRHVVNANLGSAVTCWPRCDRDSFLRTGRPREVLA